MSDPSDMNTCAHSDCFVQPSFSVPGSNNGKRNFCSAHASKGMRSMGSKKCARPGCFKSPTYGVKDSRKRDFCAQHAVQGMVDLSTRKCGGPGCSKCATYGMKGSRKRQYCAQHALAGMVDIYKKTCAFKECHTRPTYGAPGSRKREFCSRHAPMGMVNVDTPRCAREGCYLKASCGVNGRRKREFCPEHAMQGMVDLSTSKCATPGCCKCATYCAEGGGKHAFCAQHAVEGMINIDNTSTTAAPLYSRESYVQTESSVVDMMDGGGQKQVFYTGQTQEGEVWEGTRRFGESGEDWEVTRGGTAGHSKDATSTREDHEEQHWFAMARYQMDGQTASKRACDVVVDQARTGAQVVQRENVIDLTYCTATARHDEHSASTNYRGTPGGISTARRRGNNVRDPSPPKLGWPNAPLVQTPTGWSVWNWESALHGSSMAL